jgi:hypothetical protein
MRNLKTVHDVADTLGGADALCRLTGANLKQVWNWLGRTEMFPACYHEVMMRALKRRDARAPARLWAQKGLEKKAA